MKKSSFIIFLFVILVSLSYLNTSLIPVLAQNSQNSQSSQNSNPDIQNIQALENASRRISDTASNLSEKSGQDYLVQEWKKLILKNKAIAGINDFLQSKAMSTIFRIIFGEPFSFSLAFIIVVALWFYFLSMLRRALTLFSFFSPLTSSVMGLALSILLAQTKFYNAIGNLISNFIFKVPLIWKIVIIVIIIAIGIVIKRLAGQFITKLKARREEEKKAEKEQKLNTTLQRAEATINPYVDAINKANEDTGSG